MTCHHHMSSSPFCYHGLAMIPACICNRVNFGVWDGVACPFPDFGGATVEVWEWMSDFVAHITGHAIACPCWDWGWTMLVEGAPGHLSTWTIPFLVILSKQRTTTLSRVIRFFFLFSYTPSRNHIPLWKPVFWQVWCCMCYVVGCHNTELAVYLTQNSNKRRNKSAMYIVIFVVRLCLYIYMYVCMCIYIYMYICDIFNH